jgi:hypothetical protein
MSAGVRESGSVPRWVALVLASAAALVAVLPSGSASAAESPTPKLIKTYSPILMLRAQEDPPCDTSEEQFQPMPVGTVLGNPEVQLKRYEDGEPKTVKTAPTAADIAGLDDNFYLNLPGDPLNAECTYAEDFAALKKAGKAPAISYAHVASETGHGGFVVQYWFFYYFNQFNDVHEGDWEGMQISFDAADAAEAIKKGPSQIAVFQHGGGEVVDWNDDEVEKRGTHPVVYPAAGSHATFFESAIFVENGQGGAGLGCDNTTEPLRQLKPRAIQVPTYPAVGSPAQWLTYEGHWGQREKGFNTGPTGPNTKTQWLEPFTWMSGLRSASPKLPAGTLLGPAVSSAFCGTVAAVSELVNLEAQSRFGLILLLAIAALVIALPVFLTTWRPADPEPMRRRRAFGQLVRAARRLYGREWKVLVPIALTALAVLAAVHGIAWLAGKAVGETEFGGLLGPAGGKAPVKDVITWAAQPLGFAVGAGAVISHLSLLDHGKEAGFTASYRLLLSRFWRVVLGHLAVIVLTSLLALTIIGIPFAIRKYVDWLFVQQEIIFEGTPVRESLRNSSDVVRGNWWWTVRVAVFFWLIGVVVGPILTFALIFANFSLIVINLIGSIVYAILIPYVASGQTLLYFDLEQRRAGAAPVPKRDWRRLWLRKLPSPQPG